jgi:hypothetical protein
LGPYTKPFQYSEHPPKYTLILSSPFPWQLHTEIDTVITIVLIHELFLWLKNKWQWRILHNDNSLHNTGSMHEHDMQGKIRIDNKQRKYIQNFKKGTSIKVATKLYVHNFT